MFSLVFIGMVIGFLTTSVIALVLWYRKTETEDGCSSRTLLFDDRALDLIERLRVSTDRHELAGVVEDAITAYAGLHDLMVEHPNKELTLADQEGQEVVVIRIPSLQRK